MKTIALKTNIMCDACIAKVTPVLNERLGKNKWNVDTKSSQKTLTVDSDKVSESDVIEAVEAAGYKAEKLE